jgi:predicted acylesterase/phospholipase RssA
MCFAGEAGTQEAEEDTREGPLTWSVTTAGGVSQGAYQAGYLYYLSEVAKKNPDLIELRMFTGASAGMINNLLTVMALGDEGRTAPDESLLYKIWTEMRYDELLDTDKAPPLALSSRKILRDAARKVEEEWKKGLAKDVDVVIGAMASRLEVHEVELTKLLRVPRQEEKFVLRIQGRGAGNEPQVTNYVDQLHGTEQPLLPLVNMANYSPLVPENNFSSVKQLLFATSSIPIVFQPQVMDYCMTEPTVAKKETIDIANPCRIPTHKDLFIDGSLADKRPLRLAHRIAVTGFDAFDEGKFAWKEMPDLTRNALPEKTFFLYIDPTRRTFPSKIGKDSEKDAVTQAERLFPSMGGFVRNFFAGAQANELSSIVDDYPEIQERIQLVYHDFPTISGQLVNFFGFFDRKFRVFDFYLGMRDARRYVEEHVTPTVRSEFGDGSIEISYPEPRATTTKQVVSSGSWRPYFCLRAQIDGQAQFEPACNTSKMKDLLILLQATFDRLYEHCRSIPFDPTVNNAYCRKAMSGENPPKVPQVKGDRSNWKRHVEDKETEFEHTMRLLETYQFRFKDLGLERSDADLGMTRIRAVLLNCIDQFAKKLPFGESLTLRLLGKPAINFLAYAPPETILYFVVGTGAEFAVSATMGQSYWLRYNFALQFGGFYFLLSETPNVLAMTPLLGLEAEIYPLSNPLFQTRVGLRIGYQFSTGDRFGADDCNEDDFKNSAYRCSAPVAQGFVAVSFYERVRFQLGVEWFPKWLPPMSDFDDHMWRGMFLVGWQWISPF